LSNIKDISGQKFGKLTAKHVLGSNTKGNAIWHCECECGRTKSTTSNNLIQGQTTTCGECLYDLTGQRFGRLVVIGQGPRKNGKRTWECKCGCGGLRTTTSSYLKSGREVSCGCRSNIIDITGERYGRLTVLKYSHTEEGKAMWFCACECGEKTIIQGNLLRNGHTKSCGCLRLEILEATRTSHGLCNKEPRLYEIWNGIKARCNRKNHRAYEDYGGRGIKVCPEWNNDFKDFCEWAMKNGYEEDLSIDRIEVNGDYEPSNCRWTTVQEQSRNRRSNVKIEINGEIKTITEWSEISGISYSTLRNRWKKGWPTDQLFTPVKKNKWNIRRKENSNDTQSVTNLIEQIEAKISNVNVTNEKERNVLKEILNELMTTLRRSMVAKA
jgi:hypothetical protein